METSTDKIVQRCQELFKLAKDLYDIDLSNTSVQFNLRGRAAGWASMDRWGKTTIRINYDMVHREAFDSILNDTVPHEVAHLVCFKNPSLGSGHDYGWEKVCKSLGGTGKRLHDQKVVFGKGYTYEYITSTGDRVRIGQRYHQQVMQGTALCFRNNKGTITRDSTCFVVGYAGRTLENPRQITAEERESYTKIVPKKASVQSKCSAYEQAATGVASAVSKLSDAGAVNQVPAFTGPSKAAVSRQIMLFGYQNGFNLEAIIGAMIVANGYTRQLAYNTFKANRDKVGIPATFA